MWWVAFPSVFWPICQLEVWSPVLPFVFQSFSFVFQFIFEWGTWFEREHWQSSPPHHRTQLERRWKQWVAIPHHQRMNWNKGGTRPPRTVTSQTDSIDLEWGGMAASCSQALSVEGVSSFTGCGGLISPLCSRLFDNRSMVPCVFHFFFNCFLSCFN